MPIELDNIIVPPVANRNEQTAICICDTDADTEEIARSHAYNELQRDKQQAEEQISDSRQNRAQRKEYAGKIFWLVCAWLAMLTLLVGLSGTPYLRLSDTVLVALISGASINIIGLMVIVANYLFPKNGLLKQDSVKDKK